VIRRNLSRLALRATRWHVVGEAPKEGVIVGAPHTSNWDFFMALALMGQMDIAPIIMVKQDLFRGAVGWFLRKAGAIPIDRKKASGVVRALTDRLAQKGSAPLVIAPEGTRGDTAYWKSGFYHIAKHAGLSITLAFIDKPTKTTGFGPTFIPSGDIVADMNLIRAFYADKNGLRPKMRREPRLREEARYTNGERAR
jgi:1-acyl-sn-glycerol-3-phosphate acyltransferase